MPVPANTDAVVIGDVIQEAITELTAATHSGSTPAPFSTMRRRTVDQAHAPLSSQASFLEHLIPIDTRTSIRVRSDP